jgi:hypothetical protein
MNFGMHLDILCSYFSHCRTTTSIIFSLTRIIALSYDMSSCCCLGSGVCQANCGIGTQRQAPVEQFSSWECQPQFSSAVSVIAQDSRRIPCDTLPPITGSGLRSDVVGVRARAFPLLCQGVPTYDIPR